MDDGQRVITIANPEHLLRSAKNCLLTGMCCSCELVELVDTIHANEYIYRYIRIKVCDRCNLSFFFFFFFFFLVLVVIMSQKRKKWWLP